MLETLAMPNQFLLAGSDEVALRTPVGSVTGVDGVDVGVEEGQRDRLLAFRTLQLLLLSELISEHLRSSVGWRDVWWGWSRIDRRETA